MLYPAVLVKHQVENVIIDQSVSCTHYLMNMAQTTVSWGNLPIMKFIPACLLCLTHRACRYSVTGPNGYLASQDLQCVYNKNTQHSLCATLAAAHAVTPSCACVLVCCRLCISPRCVRLSAWLGWNWGSNNRAHHRPAAWKLQMFWVDTFDVISWKVISPYSRFLLWLNLLTLL